MMPSSSWIDEYAWKGGLSSKSQCGGLCVWTMFSYFLYSWWSASWSFTDQGQTALPGWGNPTDSYLTSPLWAHLFICRPSNQELTPQWPPYQALRHQTTIPRTSLVVRWLRIPLPMQGTRVQSLARELRSHMLCGQLSPQSNFWACLQRTTESMCSGPCTSPWESLHATTRESACHNKDPACCTKT